MGKIMIGDSIFFIFVETIDLGEKLLEGIGIHLFPLLLLFELCEKVLLWMGLKLMIFLIYNSEI